MTEFPRASSSELLDPRMRILFVGMNPGLLQGARVWCVPRASGRNLGTSLQQLVDAYRAAALDAGPVLG